eukprot:scaffold7227_cov34-Prasinocladus_malaysianus.AAC.2
MTACVCINFKLCQLSPCPRVRGPPQDAYHRLHLLPCGRPDIEGPDDGSHVLCRLDGRESSHAGAADEHLGGRDVPGHGELAGEEPAEGVGRLDDGAVACDVRHRRERVEGLRARDGPRHAVEPEDGHPAGLQGLHEGLVLPRVDVAEEHLALPEPADDVGLPRLLGVDHLAADRPVSVVVELSLGAGPGLDHDGHAGLDHLGRSLGRDGHPALAGGGLGDDPDG